MSSRSILRVRTTRPSRPVPSRDPSVAPAVDRPVAFLVALAVWGMLAAGGALAAPDGSDPTSRSEQRPAGKSGRPSEKPPEKPQASLDELYGRLRAAGDDAEAKGVAKLIERRLERSGSATADLLTDRARQAMAGHDFPLAAELMDRVTAIEPGWAEGWNRRATVFWLLSDKQGAIADLQRALILEPRHYEAWAALGRIYQSVEDNARALNAFRRAAALYPRMAKLQDAIDRLSPEVDGRDL